MQLKKLRRMLGFRLLCLIAVTAAALVLFYFKPPLLERVAAGFDDIKTVIRQKIDMAPQAHPDLVVVTIDEPSINDWGRWPWDRSLMAKLFESLAPASLVVMDVVFSEPSNPTSDIRMMEQIERNGNVVLGFFLRNEATQVADDEALDYLEECSYFNYELLSDTVKVREFPYAELNISLFSEVAMSCGVFTTEPDTDGLYRHYPITYIHEGNLLPSIGIQAVRQYLNQEAQLVLDHKGVASFSLGDAEVQRQNFLRINFTDQVKQWSAGDLLSGKIPTEEIEGKIIIIGVTEVGVFDMRPTPVDAVTPGVFLHYMAASNLLTDDLLVEKPGLDYVLLGLGLLLIFAVSFIKNPHLRISGYVVLVVSAMAISWLSYFGLNIWLREFYLASPMVGLASMIELIAAAKADRQHRHIKDAFSSYVSAELVQQIVQEPDALKLGGDEKEISVLFSDLRNFTAMSEGLEPKELVSMLNHIFDPMTEAILEQQGMLDKYIGDAIMALFNAPIALDNHAEKAVISALAMVEVKNEINRQMSEQGLPNVEIGIGINTGLAIVGNMGSKLRFSYTAIGDAVNLASRLEGMNKPYGSRIIVSEFTKHQLDDNSSDYLLRHLDRIRVAGKNKPVTIYEVLPYADETKDMVGRFERALLCYFERQFEDALSGFESLVAEFDDAPSRYFVSRCKTCINTSIPDDWYGVTNFSKG